MADSPPGGIPPNVRQPPPSVGGEGGTGMTAKLWGLPRWSWIALAAAAGIVGIMWWRSRSSATPATTATTGTADSGVAQGLATDQYESLLAILRDLQGQPSVSATEPGDPNISGGGPIITGGVGTTPPTPDRTPTPTARQWVDVAPYTTKNPPWNSTLSGIAAKFGTTVSRLMALNPGITNPNIIHPHQRIYIT